MVNMITGLTADTLQKLEMDAGIFVTNMATDSITDAAALATAVEAAKEAGNYLGATKGGGTFTATPSTREVEADGMRSPFVGSTRIDGWDVKLSTTVLEFTAENFKRALGAADIATSGKVKTLTARNNYTTQDYIEKVQWVGNLSDGGYVLIEINNALSVGGINFSISDKAEGTIPIELIAHQATMLNQHSAPFKIMFFEVTE